MDSRKNLRSILLYVGIPIIVLIVIGFALNQRTVPSVKYSA